MSVSGAKVEMRRAVRARLAAMSADDRRQQSAAIVAALLGSEHWATARTVLAYLAMPTEPDVDRVFRDRGDRTVCAPRADWAGSTMRAAVVEDLEAVRESRPGLREPGADAVVIAGGDLDLVLVPGLAFDRSGRRLGRGGGFYDRFLAGLPGETATVGVCFGVQVVDAVPVDAHDVRVDWLLTEGGLVRTAAS